MNHIRYQQNDVTVIECPPQCRTIAVHEGYVVVNYYLAMPWMVFILSRQKEVQIHSGVAVGFRNSELTDTDQTLYYPQLYNVWTQCLLVCMEPYRWHAGDESRAIAAFWRSTFTTSLHHAYLSAGNYSLDERVRTHEVWQQHTLEDPSFITKVNWKPCADLSALLRLYEPKP